MWHAWFIYIDRQGWFNSRQSVVTDREKPMTAMVDRSGMTTH